MFSMTLNQIKKFQNLNDISINVYPKEEQKEILSLQLPWKRGKHVISCMYRIHATIIQSILHE